MKRLVSRISVLTVIAFGLAIVVGIRVERIRLSRARYTEARAQIAELREALRRYQADYGYYPQGLSELGEYYSDGRRQLGGSEIDPGMLFPRRPIASPQPTDPWGNPYFYQSDGDTYELKSLGPNGFRQDSEDKALVARSR
jgi:general secretion pathway protein G